MPWPTLKSSPLTSAPSASRFALGAVLDVDEVEALSAVAGELRALAREQPAADGGDDAGALAGPVHVHVPQDRVAVAVGAAEPAQQHLGGRLRRRVEGVRAQRMVLADRDRARSAHRPTTPRSRRRADAGISGGAKDVERAAHVRLEGGLVLGVGRRQRQHREVQHALDARAGARDRIGVGDVADNDLAVEAVEASGRDGIEHAHARPVGEQRAHGRGADEAAAAGDEDVSALDVHRRQGYGSLRRERARDA